MKFRDTGVGINESTQTYDILRTEVLSIGIFEWIISRYPKIVVKSGASLEKEKLISMSRYKWKGWDSRVGLKPNDWLKI